MQGKSGTKNTKPPTILKVFYTKIVIFNTSLGLLYFLYCFYLAFLAYVFNVS